jgi:hypothetical protein
MAVNVQKNMGLLVLAIWLIINGLSGVIAFQPAGSRDAGARVAGGNPDSRRPLAEIKRAWGPNHPKP